MTSMTAMRKQGPGWARALDPRAPPHHQGRIAPTLVGTGSGITYHWLNLYGRNGCPGECTALLTIALESAESLGEAACFIGGPEHHPRGTPPGIRLRLGGLDGPAKQKRWHMHGEWHTQHHRPCSGKQSWEGVGEASVNRLGNRDTYPRGAVRGPGGRQTE